MMRNYSSLWGGRISFLIFSTLFFLQNLSFGQLHTTPTCITQYDLIWDSTPSGAGEVNWSTPGSFSNTFSNVDNSGIDFSFSFTGDVSTLGDWNNLGGNVTPSIGTNSSNGGVEVLEYFTDGFNSVGNITITITFSQPISSIGFDIYHVNGAGPNGDSYTITASTAIGGTIYPTFTSSATPSYTTNSTGFLNSVDNSVAGDNANVGVNFSDSDGITSITMIWDECTACTAGTVHGSAFSNFTFCKIENYDNDNDGIADNIDLDDDNDGIPDEIESCGSISGGGNVDINVEIQLDNYPGESSWTLQNSGGTTVASGSGYSTANQFIDLTYNLPADDYTFTMNDTYGDGLQDVGGYHQVKVDGSIVFGPITTTFFTHQNTFTAGVGAFSCISGNPSEDADNDGILNYQDADFCTLNGNGVCNNLDTDGDGIIDQFDLDADNDGIPDIIEAGGIDTNGDGVMDYPTANDPTSMIDVDGDGFADSVDNLDNGGGVNEVTSGTPLPNQDTDGDGLTDNVDLDADNDGIPDIIESGGVDSNGDGIVDNLLDNDLDGFADIYDPDDDGVSGIDSGEGGQPLVETDGSGNYLNGETGVNLDTDGDGLADHLDLDADNDGIPDLVEAGGIDTNGDGMVDVLTDVDGDGFADIYDTDDDGVVGIEDGTDALLKTGGTDTDADGKADDAAITYVDGDNISSDTDGDGYVDHLDLDSDNDGIPDIIEVGGISPNSDGKVDLSAAPWDSDNDGLADIYDEDNSGTALVKTTAESGTADGKVGASESMIGGSSNNVNVDNDPFPNHLDLDADNDGITDVVENAGGDVTADNTSGTLDGIVGDNSTVTDTDDNGWHDSSNTNTTDSDGDGIADYLDIDADNDGIVDYLESVCSTCPTFVLDPNSNLTDSNENGVLDIYESLTAANGTSGSNIGATPNIDDDAINTIPDYLDTDADNDGANDWTEGYDLNNNGQASDDLKTMATNYEAATNNNYYLNTNDADVDGIPDWLDNQPAVAGYDETSRPPFLDPNSSFWHDDDNDGLVDLLDSSQSGTDAPTPDNNGGNDLDWRDVTSLARLPVELSSFVVKEKDCLVELNWVTESESQFDYFEIEWSGDGHEFLKFGQVLNNGNANGSSYNLIDDNPSFTNYYRLKMVDLDGSFEYSKVVFIKLKCAKTKGEALVYPNPISPSQMLNIEFLSEQDSEQIVLVDMVGRIVRRLNLETEIGKNKISMEISDLAVGSYQLQIVGSRKSYMILIQE